MQGMLDGYRSTYRVSHTPVFSIPCPTDCYDYVKF